MTPGRAYGRPVRADCCPSSMMCGVIRMRRSRFVSCRFVTPKSRPMIGRSTSIGTTRFAEAHGGLRQAAHDRRFAVGDEHLVVDALLREDSADVVRLELHVRVLDVHLHLDLSVVRDLRRDREDYAVCWNCTVARGNCSALPAGAGVDDADRHLRTGRQVRRAVVEHIALGSA